jgi:hypothetical protein
MIIALDYDDTYSAAPELWDEFIDACERRGHDVICVSCRRDTDENREECKIAKLVHHAHYFTALSPKRWFMEQRGIKVDVWIDDLPECVKEGR